jgi:hypothetical protein
MQKTIRLLLILTFCIPAHAGIGSSHQQPVNRDFGAVYAGKQEEVHIRNGIDLNALESLLIPSNFKCSALSQAHLNLIKEQIMTPEYVTELLLSKVNDKEKQRVVSILDDIIWKRDGQGAHYYIGLPNAERRTQQDIDKAFKDIENIFKEKAIAIAHLERWDWFYPLNDALSPNPEINIARLDKAALLVELFNRVDYTLAWPVIDRTREMTLKEAQRIIKEWPKGERFDYLEEKSLKIDIWGDVMDARSYNRDNGRWAAHSAVKNALKNMIERHMSEQKEKGEAHLKGLDDLCQKSAREKVTTNLEALDNKTPIEFWRLRDNNYKELIIDGKILRELQIIPALQHVPEGANGTMRIEDVDKVKKRIEETLLKKWQAECFGTELQ